MIRGTTPTISINISGLNLTDITRMRVTFKQNDILIVREDEEIQNDGISTLFVKLTQSETLKLRQGYITFQLKVLTKDERVYLSAIKSLVVDAALDNEVI